MSKITIWLKVSNDQYELPEIVADTAGDLARKLGINKNCIFSAISHSNKKGYKCIYRKVVIDDEI